MVPRPSTTPARKQGLDGGAQGLGSSASRFEFRVYGFGLGNRVRIHGVKRHV